MIRYLLLLWVAVWVGCGGPAPVEETTAPYSREELALQLARTAPGPDQRQQAEQAMLDRKRMVADARAKGLDQDAVVQRALDTVVIQAWQEKQIDAEVSALTVSDEEIREVYEAETARWTIPETLTVAHILRRSSPENTARRTRDREWLQRMYAEGIDLPAGEGFGRAAAAHSQDQASRYRGGILAPMNPEGAYDAWRRELLAAAGDAEPGELLPVIETKLGVHLLRLVERHPARTRSIDAVRETIRSELLAEKEERLRAQVMQDLRERYPLPTDRGQ
ncbi:peptidylprolyl isomerase [Kiritimatiellaeota bacterium B1221]|nr:peptidylprolyl isomerase [Kiritimatiellaeota bacterium B1221]